LTFTASPVRGCGRFWPRGPAFRRRRSSDGNPVTLGYRVLDFLQHRVERGRCGLLVAQSGGERFNELGLVHVLSSDTQWLDSREFSFAQRMALVSRIQT
jgi:hypothetical protein